MVGLQTLNLAIGVRVPASQPKIPSIGQSFFDVRMAARFVLSGVLIGKNVARKRALDRRRPPISFPARRSDQLSGIFSLLRKRVPEWLRRKSVPHFQLPGSMLKT
jgi:hypothetical protein